MFLWNALARYSNFKLVVENEIIGISPAELSVKKNGGNIPLEKVIVSTFGVLVDSRVFLWGVKQTKLKEAVFSRETLSLRIATDRDEYHIKLLHGISDPAAISIIAEEIRYETGVTPTIEEWAHGKEESACSVNEK
ncbi:hypothetical protein LJC56_01470 [Christensenellaceae bacterium OttesenSCG-928-K19]|nr:hypothetical protein [Christensenellaceae bacterium OttesenSCG-928-K19]